MGAVQGSLHLPVTELVSLDFSRYGPGERFNKLNRPWVFVGCSDFFPMVLDLADKAFGWLETGF